MSNILINYTKWLVQCFLALILCSIVLVILMFVVTKSYNFITYDRHVKKIQIEAEIVAQDVVYNTDDGEFIYSYIDLFKDDLSIVEEDNYLVQLPDKRILEVPVSVKPNIITDKILEKYPDIVKLISKADPVCPAQMPIQITVTNNSSKAITYIAIDLEAFLPKRSTNILRYDAGVTSDYIVQPNESIQKCAVMEVSNDYIEEADILDSKVVPKATIVKFQNH